MKDANDTELVPLEIAVQCVYSAAYDDAPTNERLTGLAQALVALMPVYARVSNAEASLVPASRLRDGLVRDCGNEMRFSDGSPALTNLFVPSNAIQHAITMLAEPDPGSPPSAATAFS